MKNSIFLLVFLLLASSINIYSQVTQEWVARYNGIGGGPDWLYAMCIDDLGNVYVTGGSYGVGSLRDYTTIKYNSSGVQQWVQRYDGFGSIEEAYAIAVDNYGNVYVTGVSTSQTGQDYLTIKYSSVGIQQWVQRYNGPGQNGNFVDIPRSMTLDMFGSIYVTGTSQGNSTGYDYATIKYNTYGIQEWVERYDYEENNGDGATAIAVDELCNVYVTGSSSRNSSGYDYATIKYNSAGITKWVARYNGTGGSDDIPSSIAIDGYGNVYVTGFSRSGLTYGTEDIVTIKYNSSGVETWVSRYNGSGNSKDYANSIALDGFGNVFVTGSSGFISGDENFTTLKLNSAGVQQWVQTYNGPGNSEDVASSIKIDGFGNLYVSGRSSGSGSFLDFVTIKYSQHLTGIQPVSNEIPNNYSLSQNYPNPFNPMTKIRFDIPSVGTLPRTVRLTIYDALGREIKTLVNQQLNPGTYEADWNASNYPSGVYYYKLTSGDFTDAKKMVLIK